MERKHSQIGMYGRLIHITPHTQYRSFSSCAAAISGLLSPSGFAGYDGRLVALDADDACQLVF